MNFIDSSGDAFEGRRDAIEGRRDAIAGLWFTIETCPDPVEPSGVAMEGPQADIVTVRNTIERLQADIEAVGDAIEAIRYAVDS